MADGGEKWLKNRTPKITKKKTGPKVKENDQNGWRKSACTLHMCSCIFFTCTHTQAHMGCVLTSYYYIILFFPRHVTNVNWHLEDWEGGQLDTALVGALRSVAEGGEVFHGGVGGAVPPPSQRHLVVGRHAAGVDTVEHRQGLVQPVPRDGRVGQRRGQRRQRNECLLRAGGQPRPEHSSITDNWTV